MKDPFLFSQPPIESLSCSGSSETVVKILHIYPVPEVLEIWQSAAFAYEKANPAVKIEFRYLENEEFKAKLPTLLQSKDRPAYSTVGVLTAGRLYAADERGLPEAKLGWFFFPEVRGGKGKANESVPNLRKVQRR